MIAKIEFRFGAEEIPRRSEVPGWILSGKLGVHSQDGRQSTVGLSALSTRRRAIAAEEGCWWVERGENTPTDGAR
jgi:hypothetical protein